jgi:chemotaxis protein MotB
VVRRKHESEHANHERWLVSYADFITLLFAFFVVMFASTQADKNKAKAVSDSVRDALEHGQLTNAISVALGRSSHEAKKAPVARPPDRPLDDHPSDLAKSMETLQKGLDAEIRNGTLLLKLESRGLVISLREAAFFASGDDCVAPASIPILNKIAEVVQSLPNPVRLEGHSDSRPIHTARFKNNWELSAARAIAMLELLRDRFLVASSRMAVAGYADNAPTDTNDTEEGRAHNRRVDLVLLSAGGVAAEPGRKP